MQVQKGVVPIAIVGMAFRFPGDLSDESSFWEALKQGKDAVGQLGNERWAAEELQHPKRSEPGRSITYSAGVLSRIDQFDANFFGISPREAAWLDPQQRLLLELAWEAMENGGHVPSSLAGSDCSVYVGISGLDYGIRGLDDLSSMTAYSMTGNTLSIAANRLSYVFDLRGPSLAVDTACSSSLVALHHACNSLRWGESSVALVGGVNLLLHPYPFIGFTKASMLSANGRCRAFDAAGDGYVRGEGGAVFLLKVLDKALADGDDIHAVILATGVNADGSRKTGMTIPSSEGQAELMRSVLARSGISAADVDFIEAHGTGTAVGDPVETAAIGKVYGRSRPQGRRLPIGSVKTNLGHLEPASGMAGLVKTILSLKNRAIPPSLHLVNPNPKIDFDGLNLDVVKEYRPFADSGGKPLVAGVNSFGFGGANAHVLLQEYRPENRQPAVAGEVMPPLFLSASTEQALRDTAMRFAELLAGKSNQEFYDIAYAAAFRRERLDKRLALKPADARDAVDQLNRFARGETASSPLVENALPSEGGVAFVYSGNGSQWVGMGQKLMAESSRFAELIGELEAPIKTETGFSILDELQKGQDDSRMDDTAVAQPLLFAIQVALTTMLKEEGIDPVAVAGHSVGEVAAAWAAGELSLAEATKVICARSAAQALTRGVGRMAAVGLSEAVMREVLQAEKLDDVEIAGINSPKNVTVAGLLTDLEKLGAVLESRGIFFRLLDLDYAFHSRHMDPIKARLLDNLADLAPRGGGSATFVSTVTGDVLEAAALNGSYWWLNVRQPVRFAEGIGKLASLGCKVLVEIGPHAILQRYMSECLGTAKVDGRVLPTLRRNDDGAAVVEQTALRIHLLCESSRKEVFFPVPGQRVRLPNYPWQRERHWLPRTSEGFDVIQRYRVHPLLGWRLKETEFGWQNVIDPVTTPWLSDHKVGGAIVLPGAAYVEMALAAAREWTGGEQFELEELDIVAPVVFDGEHGRSLRFELSARDGSFQIRSRQRLSDDEWALNAVGRLLGAPTDTKGKAVAFAGDQEGSVIDRETHYRLAAALGLDYGPVFQGLSEARVTGTALWATLDRACLPVEGREQYLLHPAVLDVCFQSLVDFFQADIEAGRGMPLLPIKVGRLKLFSKAGITGFRTHVIRQSTRSVLADFELVDADGNAVAQLSGCRFRAAALHRRSNVEPSNWQIKARLQPHPLDSQSIAFAPTSELASELKAWFGSEEGRLKRDSYFREALPLLEALSVSFAYEAFQHLFAHNAGWVRAALDNPEAVAAVPLPWFHRLVACLRQEDLLIKAAGQWELAASDIPSAQEIWLTILRDFPECLLELMHIGRVGRRLPALLTGEIDRQSFVDGLLASHVTESLYEDAPAYLGTRLAIQQTLIGLAGRLAANRRLRILEIAPGVSEIPRQIAALTDIDRLDYVLAHADDQILARLNTEYQDHPFVTVAELDGEGLGLSAELPLPEAFDVIILRHSLHRVTNPMAMLAAARRRLASGGLLLLAERQPDLSVDLVSGLDPLWWYDRGANGAVSRLLSFAGWKKAMAEQGFDEIEAFVEPAGDGLVEGSFLVLGKSPRANAPVDEQAAFTWLLLSDAQGSSLDFASRLQRYLEGIGQRVVLTTTEGRNASGVLPVFHPRDPDSVAAVVAAARQHLGGLDHVVHLAGWENGAGDSAFPESDPSVGLLHLVQCLVKEANQSPRLWLLPRGGALMAEELKGLLPNPVQASLWGLGRVIMNEYPALACTLVDVAADAASPDSVGRVANELLRPDGEAEIIIGPGERHVLRLEAVQPDVANHAAEAPRFRLDFLVPGQLRNLLWLPQPELSLKDDEIEVRPVASGLNFRDIMYVMGLLPDEAVENGFAGASLGLEFSGVVTRIGAGVQEYSPGDAVMGFGSACFSSHVVTKASAVAPKPEGWTFEAAATVPTVFFTVYYALKHLADLQPGERVLIHGAAGGVGIAAVQLARYLGAEVFATAGSDEKRDFVRLLGADHVLDSRSLAYADEILAMTGGEGVDVVLNSLAGEAIRRNLQVLKPFGRFLELGKRDFFENTPIGLRPFKDNISYFGIDADQLLIARPALAAKLFREVMELFHEGVLSPLPCRVFPAERVVDAFRVMQQARHIGKVVVNLDGARVKVETPKEGLSPLQFNRDATYLVTGGISGFGLESALWLAERGAGNLVLLSRRGERTPGAAEAIERLNQLGAEVRIVACDVADREALASVLARIRREMPPLKGILHAAMVLDDALIENLDGERFSKVLAPKLLGAWNLHSLTLDIPLDHFILYSSITTFIGNPGQANYVAANGYLEGLAAMRRDLGLPATCIGWGPIGDAGYLARNEAVKQSLAARLGAEPLAAKNALAMLETLCRVDGGVVAVADFDWQALLRLLPSAHGPRFMSLRRLGGKGSAANDSTEDFQALIAGKSMAEATEIVRKMVCQEVAQILSISVERIDPAKPLHDLGMDSLMGVELALGLERRFGIQLPAMLLNEGPTVDRLSVRLVEKILGGQDSQVEPDNRLDVLVTALAAQHGESFTPEDIAQTAAAAQELSQSDRSQDS